jgi:hypothetical protein
MIVVSKFGFKLWLNLISAGCMWVAMAKFIPNFAGFIFKYKPFFDWTYSINKTHTFSTLYGNLKILNIDLWLLNFKFYMSWKKEKNSNPDSKYIILFIH